MKLRTHAALGIVIGAALDRMDVRKVSSVFYDGDELIINIEFIHPALEDVAVYFTEKDVGSKKMREVESWADDLLDRQLGSDDDEPQDNQEDDEKEGSEG